MRYMKRKKALELALGGVFDSLKNIKEEFDELENALELEKPQRECSKIRVKIKLEFISHENNLEIVKHHVKKIFEKIQKEKAKDKKPTKRKRKSSKSAKAS